MKTTKLITILFVLSLNSVLAQDVVITRVANVSFFSQTPIEDIKAVNNSGASALNLKTGEIYFKVENTSFSFGNRLMEEHFNENYMESEKYPNSEFKGKIIDKVDLKQPGRYAVTVEGQLTLHGVTKTYKVMAVIINSNGNISATAKFQVKVVDHAIEIPTIVFSKIAEIIDVSLVVNYSVMTQPIAKK